MKNIEEFASNIEILKKHEFPNFTLTLLKFKQDINQIIYPLRRPTKKTYVE